MAKFAAASDALTAALAIVDARLTNIEENEQLELYLQLIERRAKIQQANQVPAFTNSPVNFGTVNQAVLKPSAGTVYRLYCYNKNASTRFFQIHNKATAPVNTDIPVTSFPIASNTALIIDSTFWGANGRACSTGIAWAFSSTEATLTLATAADQTSAVGYL